jgi:ribonuclease HI
VHRSGRLAVPPPTPFASLTATIVQSALRSTTFGASSQSFAVSPFGVSDVPPEHHVLFTDGAARAGGAAGYGLVLLSPTAEVLYTGGAYLGPSHKITSMQSEYLAFIAGLRLAHSHGVTKLLAISDSHTMVGQVLGHLACGESDTIGQLCDAALNLIELFPPSTFTLRHHRRGLNTAADKAANDAIDFHLGDCRLCRDDVAVGDGVTDEGCMVEGVRVPLPSCIPSGAKRFESALGVIDIGEYDPHYAIDYLHRAPPSPLIGAVVAEEVGGGTLPSLPVGPARDVPLALSVGAMGAGPFGYGQLGRGECGRFAEQRLTPPPPPCSGEGGAAPSGGGNGWGGGGDHSDDEVDGGGDAFNEDDKDDVVGGEVEVGGGGSDGCGW